MRDDAGLHTGRLQDDLAAKLGGDWRPVEHSLAPVVMRLLELDDGAAAFALLSSPHGRHGVVLLKDGGEVYFVETQNPVGQRVWAAVGADGRPVMPPWLRGAGARVIVVNAAGKVVPLVDNAGEPLATGSTTADALIDDSPTRRYMGSGTENEFSNVIDLGTVRDISEQEPAGKPSADLRGWFPRGRRLDRLLFLGSWAT